MEMETLVAVEVLCKDAIVTYLLTSYN